MFIPMITTVVILLLITAYMASNTMVSDATKVKIAFEKAKFTFNVEDMLKSATDSLCQSETQKCKDNYDSSTDTITITMSDLSNYLPTGFVNSNLIGGSYGDVLITDNNTTITLQHSVPDDIKRNVYLHHYRGLEYSIYPDCASGDRNDFPPCDNDNVIHRFPTAAETRTALE